MTETTLIQTFLVTLFATGLGAVAGTYAAHAATDKFYRRREIIQKISACNVAISHAFAVTNHCLSIKKQYIKPINDEYNILRAKYIIQTSTYNQKIIKSNIFSEQLNFQNIFIGRIDCDYLINACQQIGDVHPKVINLAIGIKSSWDALNEMSLKRTKFIENHFKDPTEELSEFQKFALLCGVPFTESQISTEYPDCIAAIYRSCDDCIYFSLQYGLELEKLRDCLSRIAWKEHRHINKIKPKSDFSSVKHLLPSDNQYKDWSSGFKGPKHNKNYQK